MIAIDVVGGLIMIMLFLGIAYLAASQQAQNPDDWRFIKFNSDIIRFVRSRHPRQGQRSTNDDTEEIFKTYVRNSIKRAKTEDPIERASPYHGRFQNRDRKGP